MKDSRGDDSGGPALPNVTRCDESMDSTTTASDLALESFATSVKTATGARGASNGSPTDAGHLQPAKDEAVGPSAGASGLAQQSCSLLS